MSFVDTGHIIRPLSFKMMGKLMTSFVVAILGISLKMMNLLLPILISLHAAMSNVLSVAAISFFIPTLQPFLTKQVK